VLVLCRLLRQARCFRPAPAGTATEARRLVLRGGAAPAQAAPRAPLHQPSSGAPVPRAATPTSRPAPSLPLPTQTRVPKALAVCAGRACPVSSACHARPTRDVPLPSPHSTPSNPPAVGGRARHSKLLELCDDGGLQLGERAACTRRQTNIAHTPHLRAAGADTNGHDTHHPPDALVCTTSGAAAPGDRPHRRGRGGRPPCSSLPAPFCRPQQPRRLQQLSDPSS
jgi:hypothetical protein